MTLRAKPGDTIGILGGGQLGRMLSMAAANLGLRTIILDPDERAPAAHVANNHICAPFTDADALKTLVEACSVITYEFENVPLEAISQIQAQGGTVHPNARALETAQDRLTEKTFFQATGLTVAPFRPIDQTTDFSSLSDFQYPAILKTRRLGYDGKGQVKIEKAEQVKQAWKELKEVPCCLEGFVSFDGEASVIAVRAHDGQMAVYPLTENTHENHILAESKVPSRWQASHNARALETARKVAAGLDYIGCFAIEFFVTGDGLIVNEMAPRVHNSGHWTLDGAVTSQFENHIRAICGWPLGSAEAIGNVTMRNLVGAEVDQWPALLADPTAKLHLYGKREARDGRKMGHVTWVK